MKPKIEEIKIDSDGQCAWGGGALPFDNSSLN